jgi:HD superfamily phosphodiesterase
MKRETRHNPEMLFPFAAGQCIPTEAECRALWLRLGVPDELTAHSRMVAELARILAVYLRRTGLEFNVDLIVAGGYLHDLVKGRGDHDGIQPPILRRMSCAQEGQDGEINEADLVFLAEHCIEENRLGAVNGTPKILQGYSHDNLEGITSRANRVEMIADRVERLLGLSLGSIVQKHRRGIQTASVQGIRNVYLIVHGAVGFKTDGEYLTHQELPLCPEGIHQARALRDELHDVPLSKVYCSDLISAIETATIIAEPHRLEPRVLCGLNEVGAGELSMSTSAKVHQLYLAQRGHDMLNFRPPGGGCPWVEPSRFDAVWR